MNVAIFYGFGNVLIPKPEPKPILEAIAKYKATYIPAVPTLYNGMINFPDLRITDDIVSTGLFSRRRRSAHGDLKNFEKLTGAQICEGYGLTETSPITHCNPYGPNQAVTIGLPISNTDAKLVDVDDYNKEITEPGAGETVLKGPQVMKGYINRPDETALALKDGWLSPEI